MRFLAWLVGNAMAAFFWSLDPHSTTEELWAATAVSANVLMLDALFVRVRAHLRGAKP